MKRFTIIAGLMILSSPFSILRSPFSILHSQNVVHPLIGCANDVWVNSYNGVLFYQRTDVSLANRSMPLAATFYYNSSMADTSYGYGRGWALGYEWRYRRQGDTVTIVQGDGRRDDYVLEGGVYKAPAGVFNRVTANGNGVSLVTPEGTRYSFGDTLSKRVTRIEDRNNNYIGLTYEGGRVVRLYDRVGRSLLLEYYADGLLSRVKVEGTTREWRYLYDNGNLVSVTDPLGNTQHYGYDAAGRIDRFTDAAGHSTWVTYNKEGQAHRVRTELSDMSLRYEQASRQTVIVHYLEDAHNQFTTYRWDSLGRVVEKTGNCCGYTSRLAYDQNDNVIRSEDALGNVTSYTYDANGNMLSMTDPMGNTQYYTYSSDYNLPTTFTDKAGRQTTFEYDERGNLTRVSGEGSEYRYYHNAFGQLTSMEDVEGHQTQYTYDAYGNLATMTDALGGVYSYSYDLFGDLLSATTPLGYTTTYSYDEEGRLTWVEDAVHTRTTMEYDATGRVTSITSGGVTQGFERDALGRATKVIGPLGDTTFYTFNAKDNVTAVRDAEGNVTRYLYDDRDRLTATINALGDTTRYTRDALGRLTGVATVDGGYTEYVYDALGRLVEASDQTGLTMRNSYDVLGRRTQALSAKGMEGGNYVFDTVSYSYDVRGRLAATHSPRATMRYAYDTLGRLTAVSDGAGHTDVYSYDALGRMMTHTDPLGNMTQMEYDADGRLTTVTDARGNATQYQYDGIGRRTLVTYANSKTERFIYTPQKNRLENMTDMAGNRIWYRYDDGDRLTAVCYPTDTTRYSYDVIGRLTEARNAAATVHKMYDALGRIKMESTTLTLPNIPHVTNTTRYNYNDANRNTVVTYPSGAVVRYQYDPRGRIHTVGYKTSDAVTGYTTVASYASSLDDRVERLTYGNGVTTHYNRNAEGRLSSLVADAGGEVPGWNLLLQSQHLTYDPVGNILSKVDSVNLAMSHFYQYDPLSRLVGTENGEGTVESYSYDALGNRVTVTKSGNTVNYSANAVNGYTAVGGQAMEYDGNGNLTSDGEHTYQYDYANRLVSVDYGNTATYRYDALGRRVLKETGGGGLTYYRYAGSQMVEADSTVYLYSSKTDDLLAAVRGGSLYYYHKDNQGSTVAVSDGSGQAVERYSYDAFGRPTYYSGTGSVLTASAIGNDILFTGREYDSETGLYYYRARTMNPATGRFLQQDPTGYNDGMNRYAYTGNNPVMYTDPTGLKGVSECGTSAKGKTGLAAELCLALGFGFCAELEVALTTRVVTEIDLPFLGEVPIALPAGIEIEGAGGIMEGLHVKADVAPVIDVGETPNYGHFSFETEEYDQQQGGFLWLNLKEKGQIMYEEIWDNMGYNDATILDFHANSSELSVGPVTLDLKNMPAGKLDITPSQKKLIKAAENTMENNIINQHLKMFPKADQERLIKYANMQAIKTVSGVVKNLPKVPINVGYSQGTMHKFSFKATF